MRIRRLLSATVGIILLVVVGLPLALWVGFPTVAPLLAAPLLKARGVDLIRLETRRPDLRGLDVTTLELTASAAGLGLRGEDIRIRWEHPLRAIEDGLSSVIIGHLALTLNPPPAAPDAGSSAPPPITMPAALLAGLPTRHLEITVLTARGRVAEQAFAGEGTLRASPNDANFSGIIQADALPAPVAMRAAVRPDDQVSLRVETTEESGPFLAVDGALSPTPAGATFAGRAHLDLDRIQSWLDAPEPWPSGLLNLQLTVGLHAEPTLLLEPTSTAQIQVRHEDLTVAVVLALTEPLGIAVTDGRLSFASGSLPVQIDARRETSAATWELQGRFDLAAVDIDADLDAVAHLTGTGKASWRDGSGAFALDLPLRAEIPSRRLQLTADAELILRDLEHQHAGLAHVRIYNTAPSSFSTQGLLEVAELALVVDDPDRLELTASLQLSPAWDIDAAVEEASLPLSNNSLLAMVLPATLAPRSGRVDIDGRLQRSAAGAVDADLQTRWQNAGIDLPAARIRGASGAAAFKATFKVAFDAAFDDDADADADAVPHSTLNLDIASATTSIERLEWISAEGPQATILLEGLRGSGSGSIGVSLDAGLELGDIAMSIEIAAHRIARAEIGAREVEIEAMISGGGQLPDIEGRLRLASAAVGVPVNDLVCGFQTVDLEAWQLHDCFAAVLGGEVRLPRGDFDLTTGSGYLPLAVTGMQLSAVLGLMQDQALDGSGTLDGSLPLRLKTMNPVVEQGWIAVRPPGGVLAYTTAANVLAGIEQPAMRLTLRAVRDLRYQRLESRVDYSEDGTLTLAVDLLGSNPEIEEGRPIQLNLNVTQNLPKLLQSLRLSDNIEQELRRRMQRVQP